MLPVPELAGRIAEQFVRELGITELPVDPIAIAEDELDIHVEAKPASSKGISGMLLRLGEEYAIVYATHIQSEGFQRFSVAHEIGHFKLPGHIDHIFDGGRTVHESRAGFASGDPYELEADHYAAGLLMPAHLFSVEMNRVGDGLDAIESLSTACRTSLEATAIRYVQRTDVPAAIILSSGQRIDYCFMSEPLKEVEGLDWIRKGTPVPAGTATERFNADPANVAAAERLDDTTSLMDWFGGEWAVELEEEVKGLGSYGKTLTVLYAPEGFDLEDAEDNANLEQSYVPRFRKR